MTTAADLREYLDAHGVEGAPTEPGWYVARTDMSIVVVVVSRISIGLVYGIGSTYPHHYLFASDIVRHAPMLLAPPAGRDLDAEVVAGVQAGRDDLPGLAEKPGK